MTVAVQLTGDLRVLLGSGKLTVDLPSGSTVEDVFTCLAARYGEPFSSRVFTKAGVLEHTIAVFLNGRNIQYHGGLEALLSSGDPDLATRNVEIAMLPMMEGG